MQISTRVGVVQTIRLSFQFQFDCSTDLRTIAPIGKVTTLSQNYLGSAAASSSQTLCRAAYVDYDAAFCNFVRNQPKFNGFKNVSTGPRQLQDDKLSVSKALTECRNKSGQEQSNSHPAHDWCLSKARAIAGCYRRDEAHDPETFAAGLAVVLADYPAAIVEYAADPRTGVVSKFPMGLPNVGQIKEFCDGVLSRQERIARYASLGPAKRYEPPPLKPGQITYQQFLDHCKRTGQNPRPIGAFEPGGYLGALLTT